MTAIRVFLADDHALLRAGMRALLKSFPDVQVVAEAGDGLDALRLIGECRPDVVLMDISMPGMNGLDVLARTSKEFPNVRVLVLSMHSSEEYVLCALRAGAAGYIVKDAAPAELGLALKAAVRGEIYLSPVVSKHVVNDYARRVKCADHLDGENTDPCQRLTPRQRQTLQLIAEGRTTRQIASLLQISSKTVETYRTQLMAKLDVHSVAGLVRCAISIGLAGSDAQAPTLRV
jgi:DNA-binding NarL/FixJ family response regulator